MKLVQEIEDLVLTRTHNLYPLLDINIIRQNNELDYNEELDKIAVVEMELNRKQ